MRHYREFHGTISPQHLYQNLGEHLMSMPAAVTVLDQRRNIEVTRELGQMTAHYNAMVQPEHHLTALESLRGFAAAAAIIHRNVASGDARVDLYTSVGKGALEFATTQPPPSGDDTSDDER